jgi:hypothetical protein
MFLLKWSGWMMIALIWMGGTDFAGCESGCMAVCSQAQIEENMALDEWNAAQEAYNAALNNGADQNTLNELAVEETQARSNYQSATQNRQNICG